jgi:hypothetical protein
MKNITQEVTIVREYETYSIFDICPKSRCLLFRNDRYPRFMARTESQTFSFTFSVEHFVVCERIEVDPVLLVAAHMVL